MTATAADYEAVLADHRRLVRALDVAMHGDAAAPQASLCDLIEPARRFRELILCLIENNPDEPISDAGHVVLDLWRHDARKALGLPEPAKEI